MKAYLRVFFSLLSILALFIISCKSAASTQNFEKLYEKSRSYSSGERIALFAESFVGTPYDPDPLGEYVTKKAIVADDRVDCMYLVFRSVELGLSKSPEEARNRALEFRFITHGKLDAEGNVQNYDERFQYAEDMIRSGKWGRDLTPLLGENNAVPGSRGIAFMNMLPKENTAGAFPKLISGDIVFFVKAPEKRTVGEIIGHLGILKLENGKLFLIHASGSKNKGGTVKKVLFKDYLNEMPFTGIIVTRLE